MNSIKTVPIFYSRWSHLFIKRQTSEISSNISSTENDVNIRIGKALTAIDSLRKSDKIKREYFQSAAISQLLNNCIT